MAIGGILARNTDGTVTQTGPGTVGQVLTSGGAGVVPTFQTISTSGGSTLIGLMRLLGDGATTIFNLADLAEYVVDISNAGSTVDPALYTLSSDQSQVTFSSAPTAGNVLTFEYVVAAA